MTFNQFEKTVKHFRDDVIVSQHGSFCNNKSKNTLGIIFLKNGKESRVYNYSGTYREILTQLKITDYYMDEDITEYQFRINQLRKSNGTKSIFSDKTIDNTKEIAEIENKINEKLKSYKVE